MPDDNAAVRQLEATRTELRHVLKLDGPGSDGVFPRSRIMRMLTSRRVTPALAVAAVAFLATLPGVAGQFVRAAPVINVIRRFGSVLR